MKKQVNSEAGSDAEAWVHMHACTADQERQPGGSGGRGNRSGNTAAATWQRRWRGQRSCPAAAFPNQHPPWYRSVLATTTRRAVFKPIAAQVLRQMRAMRMVLVACRGAPAPSMRMLGDLMY